LFRAEAQSLIASFF